MSPNTNRICAAPGCGKSFAAKRASARFCCAACRAAHHRSERIAIGRHRGASPGSSVRYGIPNPRETLDILLAKFGYLSNQPLRELRWLRVDDVTWRLLEGRRAVAHVIDRGPGSRASWHALCGATHISPGDIEASGISADATLADAKLVAEAMATGDIRPLVLAAHHNEDCTDDMRLALAGLLELVSTARPGA